VERRRHDFTEHSGAAHTQPEARTALQSSTFVWSGQLPGPWHEDTGAGALASATQLASQLTLQHDGWIEQTYCAHAEQLS